MAKPSQPVRTTTTNTVRTAAHGIETNVDAGLGWLRGSQGPFASGSGNKLLGNMQIPSAARLVLIVQPLTRVWFTSTWRSGLEGMQFGSSLQ